MIVTVTIPGEPVAQGRPRGRTFGGHVVMHDPPKSRSWKGVAQVHYQEALRAAGVTAPAFPAGPLAIHVVAVFACPRSTWRKTRPVPRRFKATKPDAENVLKAVQDAGNGLLWTDDSQIADARIEKQVAAQEEAPYVRVIVTRLEELA